MSHLKLKVSETELITLASQMDPSFYMSSVQKWHHHLSIYPTIQTRTEELSYSIPPWSHLLWPIVNWVLWILLLHYFSSCFLNHCRNPSQGWWKSDLLQFLMNLPTSRLWHPVWGMDLRAKDIVKARNYHKTSKFFLNKWLVNVSLKAFLSLLLFFFFPARRKG